MRTEQATESMYAHLNEPGFDGNDPAQLTAVERDLNRQLTVYIAAQYVDPKPMAILTGDAEWTFTQNIDVLMSHKPVHDCATCREAVDLARRYLEGDTARWVAFADISYTCVFR